MASACDKGSSLLIGPIRSGGFISDVFFMFSIDLDMIWFIVGEAIIGVHPLSNAMIALTLLRPYRRALRKIWQGKTASRMQYSSIMVSNPNITAGDCLL
ncbi:unnamed protein product [Toxocara canis]|uniref:Na_H_antiporter domain-containing protein n=1 Tax=Toxocara canis TaxID=6265 RepID=A0A183U7Z3_TOXCA|nr:unnamed protein product [Toxocara canis]